MRTILSASLLLGLVALACSSDGSGETQSQSPDRTAPAPAASAAPPSPSDPSPSPSTDPSPSPSTDPSPSPARATSTPSTPPPPTPFSLNLPPAPDDLPPLPGQPAGIPFPTSSWPEAPPPDFVDQDRLAAVLSDTFDAESARYGRIDALLVVSGGQLVLESYGNGFSAELRHDSWSVAKSITHALLGIAAREGRLDPFAPAAVEEWSSDGDPRVDITPDMLARMSSGLEWNELRDAPALVARAGGQNVAALQAERSLVASPDLRFNYSTGSTAINGRLLGDSVGTGQRFVDWAESVLFGPLGIHSARLRMDADGYWVAGYGADMRARDFARFGLFYLRDGVWTVSAFFHPAGWTTHVLRPGLPVPMAPDSGSISMVPERSRPRAFAARRSSSCPIPTWSS